VVNDGFAVRLEKRLLSGFAKFGGRVVFDARLPARNEVAVTVSTLEVFVEGVLDC